MRSAGRRTEASEEQAERMRTRVRLLVQLTTRHGRYRRGLVQAAKSLAPEEAAVLADLEAHGLVHRTSMVAGTHARPPSRPDASPGPAPAS